MGERKNCRRVAGSTIERDPEALLKHMLSQRDNRHH
jgi:hypothetical protein